AGNPQISGTVDPVTGGGACATASGSDQGPGVASYRLPTVTGNGYTLLGSPTVIANLNVTGQFAFIAARLWDVNTATNTETLVARGIYRINSNNPNGQQVFQLHPGAWHFAAGHVPKLELLGQDSPYARTSNGQFSIAVSGLQLRLPVHDVPGAAGVPQIVRRPRPAVLPGTCTARPFSTVSRRRTRASRHRIFVAGTAGELRCAHASRSARRRAHVVHLFVIIFRPAAHGRCRFLLPSGGLSRPRRCTRAARFSARGTTHWKLRLRIQIPRGRYVIEADPVDGLHHHQLPDPASMVSVFVR